ncbi:MAG: TonB-dependent receptor [Myxococcota bacterium]
MRRWLALIPGLVVLAVAVDGLAEARPTLTRAPGLLEAVEPQYPVEALEKRIEGPVELWIDIGADGTVTNVRVASAPDPLLGVAAVIAARALRFSPAEVDGEPAPIRIAYTYQFRLDALSPPPTEPQTRPQAPKTIEKTGQPEEPRARASPEEPGAQAQPALFEAVVRTRTPPPAVGHYRLEGEELRTTPGAFGDPLRVLETLPGVGRAPFSSGILVLRGSSPDDSGVYIDGHLVPILYHFGGGPSVIPPDAIESIELAPGGFGARYGRSTAGIIEVETRRGRTDGVYGGADVDLFDAGGTIEGPIGELGSFRVSGRRSYIDALIPLIPGDSGDRAILTLAPRYYDYHSRIDIEPWDGVEFTLVASGSDDELSLKSRLPIGDVPPELRLQMSAHRINPRFRADLGHGFELRLSPAAAWISTSGETPFEFLDLSSHQRALRTELIGRGEFLTTTLGVDLVRDSYRFTARVPIPGAREFVSPDPRDPQATDVAGQLLVVQTGVFGEVQAEVGRFRITPGLRLEHVQFLGRAESAIDPRLDVRARLLPGLDAKVTLGAYHRLPNPDELARATGNPQLELERSVQSAVGAEWQLSDTMALDVQVFAKRMTRMARRASEPRVSGSRLVRPRYESDGEGRVWGAEVLLSRSMSRGISGWLAYSLSRSERRHQGREWSLYVRDQTHNLSFVVSVDLPSNLRAGVRYRYVTGYPDTPVDGYLYYDSDAARFVPKLGEIRSDRLPSFQQLDLRLEKAFGSRDATHVIAYIDVQNVTNRRNAEFFYYSFDFSKRYDFPGLPILPSIGLEARF